MPDAPLPTLPDHALNQPGLAEVLLNISPAGVMMLHPIYAADGAAIIDFSWGLLNAAAQQMLKLPAQPAASFLTLYPTAVEHGVFGFYRDAFGSGELARRNNLYQHDGLDGYYALVAQRHGGALVVSFTDANDQPRTAIEEALRASQAREQAARAQAEAVQATLLRTLEQTPAAIAIFDGPEHRITFANAEMALIWGRAPAVLLGRPHFEALPDLAGQGLEAIFADVYRSGKPYFLHELAVAVNRLGHDQPTRGYYDIVYQPLYDENRVITGIVAAASEVTEQVLARQKAEQANQDLEAQVLARTQALREAHAATEREQVMARWQVQQLNDQLMATNEALEARVLARTAEVQQSRAAAEHQQGELARVFEQAPVAIAVYRGPQYIIELANPTVCRLWGRRAEDIIGKGLFEALPEVAGMGFEELLDQVMATGEPYVAHAMPAVHDRDGHRDTLYWDFVYVALHEDDGRIYGAMVVATDVTEQVVARQQVQQLNDELEVRVSERTAEAQAALAEAQSQRAQLHEQQNLLSQILGQVPASVATLIGPEHRFAFFNKQYLSLSADRAVLGQTVAEVFPEVVSQGFIDLLDKVYATGEPFVGADMPAELINESTGELAQHYVDFVYQPLRDGQGQIQGILAFIIDTTDKVLARQQADTLRAEALAVTERRAVEREELYQVFEQAPVVLAQLRGPEHFIQYRNPAFQALFPGRALTGFPFAEAMPEVVAAGLIPVLNRVYATGQPYYGTELPIVATPANGSAPQERYFDFSYQPYRESGLVQGISIFANDVTEQVLARRQADTLRAAALAAVQRRAQQRQELYQIFAQTPVAIVLLREPDHRIDYFNPAFEELFPPEEWTSPLAGHRLDEVYPRIKIAGLVELLDRVFETGETQVIIDMPLANLQPGSPRYVTLSYQAYREEGHIVGVAAFAYDVTEQVRARQQVEAQQADLRRIFEQTPVAICVFQGPDYRLELVNPLMGEMLGHAPADILHRPFFEAIPELAGQGLRALLDEVRRTGTPFVAQEQPIRLNRHGADGFGIFNFVYQPLQNTADADGVVCVATEVTEQVRARHQVQTLNEELQATNEELNDSNTRLKRTNTDLDTFVYSASHDLKSPITNIEGLLLALRQQLPAAALAAPLVPRLLEMMEGAVARFQETLGHLTNVTRLQHEQLDQLAEAVDLPALVESVRLDIEPELLAAAATLTLRLHDCPTVYCSPKNLRSILYNLISNAVKYRDPARPAEVLLSCHRGPAGQVVLEVQDNGLGLSVPQQQELFRLFRRLHTHVEGSGVGLYMVKKMVENAGGSLAVRSEPGVGSTFAVTLPALLL